MSKKKRKHPELNKIAITAIIANISARAAIFAT